MSAQVCPIVGTKNDVLPPTHPEVDLARPGQKCPVTNATTDHHSTLHKHPSIPSPESPIHPKTTSIAYHEVSVADANTCPFVKQQVAQDPQARAMDDAVCPVIGPATTVLPPSHPKLEATAQGAEKVCPVTKASWGSHQGVVHEHPSVAGAGADMKTCPVVGMGAGAGL